MLVAFVTLVCVYFGAWNLTSTAGTRAVARHLEHPGVNLPAVVCRLPLLVETRLHVGQSRRNLDRGVDRRHFLWMLGPVVELPHEFTDFVGRVEGAWETWRSDDSMEPLRVHGGVI